MPILGDFMASYDKQLMLKMVEEYLTGEGGAKLLARKHGLHEEKIRLWVSRYRAHGTAGLCPKRGSYSADFKLEVLQRQHREQLSCRQVAALYDIRNSNQIAVWRQQYETGGLPALETKHRRHTGTMQKPKPPLCPAELNKNDANTLQALREENERLRAEVAYLKKLQALIQEKKLAAQ